MFILDYLRAGVGLSFLALFYYYQCLVYVKPFDVILRVWWLAEWSGDESSST